MDKSKCLSRRFNYVNRSCEALVLGLLMAPFDPVPSGGCVSGSKFAAFTNTRRHLCRQGLAASRCLGLSSRHLIIHFGGWYTIERDDLRGDWIDRLDLST